MQLNVLDDLAEAMKALDGKKLGAFLFQLWTGLRWSDMQRIAPQQLVFDYQDIRGIAWRTKTTTKGQAFGCLASGFMSLDSHTWLLLFFRALDTIFSKHGDSQLDFMIPRITMKTSLELVLPLGCSVLFANIHSNSMALSGIGAFQPEQLHHSWPQSHFFIMELSDSCDHGRAEETTRSPSLSEPISSTIFTG